MTEKIYYVDDHDNPTGETAEKLSAHNSNTRLHAAFSSYIFNSQGKFLVTQRAHTKKVWHGVWTNTCCGHPMPQEDRKQAVKRRLQYELGIDISVEDITLVVPDYKYKTPAYDGIVEHEYCPIYVIVTDNKPIPNPDEVEDYKWVDWDWYVRELESDSDDYSIFKDNVPEDKELGQNNIPKWSWWCKDQLTYLEKNEKFNQILDELKD